MYNQGSFMEVIQALRMDRSKVEAQLSLLSAILEQRDLEISVLKKEIESLKGVTSERSYEPKEVPLEEREEIQKETPALVSPKRNKSKKSLA